MPGLVGGNAGLTKKRKTAQKNFSARAGSIAQLLRVRFPAFPKFFSEKSVYVAEVYQQPCLEESGQWVENVDRTHLVEASG